MLAGDEDMIKHSPWVCPVSWEQGLLNHSKHALIRGNRGVNEAKVSAAAAEEGMATSPCETQETQEKGHLHWVSENRKSISGKRGKEAGTPGERELCCGEYSL